MQGAQLFRKLREGEGPVLREADGPPVFDAEEGVVDLAAPRVHHRADKPPGGKSVPGHRLERGDADARFVRRPGETLHHRHPDAHAREGPGSVGHREQVHVHERELRVFQHVLPHRKERAAVGETAALGILAEKPPVAHERAGGRLRRGFKGKDQHSSAPSMVIFRPLSESFSMVTRTSSPKKASSTFSLHSTAQTAPRLR